MWSVANFNLIGNFSYLVIVGLFVKGLIPKDVQSRYNDLLLVHITITDVTDGGALLNQIIPVIGGPTTLDFVHTSFA